MLKATWRRLGSSAWLSIGLIILVPALAEAQLFPNRTIRRERPAPPQEAPFNAQVRRDYFGYYPTCWSKFPEGWACPCPNPELPNLKASLDKYPVGERRNKDENDLPLEGDEEGMPGNRNPAPLPGDNPLPLPNPGRSPFDMDTPTPPAGRPPGPAAPTPPDPFTTPAPTNPKPTTGNRPAAPSGLMEMPSLPATSPTTSNESNLPPGGMELVPEATLTSNSGSARPDLGPLPSAPTPAPFTPSNGSMVVETEPIANMPSPVPAQAPKRRSLLGSLFGRNNSTRR